MFRRNYGCNKGEINHSSFAPPSRLGHNSRCVLTGQQRGLVDAPLVDGTDLQSAGQLVHRDGHDRGRYRLEHCKDRSVTDTVETRAQDGNPRTYIRSCRYRNVGGMNFFARSLNISVLEFYFFHNFLFTACRHYIMRCQSTVLNIPVVLR